MHRGGERETDGIILLYRRRRVRPSEVDRASCLPSRGIFQIQEWSGYVLVCAVIISQLIYLRCVLHKKAAFLFLFLFSFLGRMTSLVVSVSLTAGLLFSRRNIPVTHRPHKATAFSLLRDHRVTSHNKCFGWTRGVFDPNRFITALCIIPQPRSRITAVSYTEYFVYNMCSR